MARRGSCDVGPISSEPARVWRFDGRNGTWRIHDLAKLIIKSEEMVDTDTFFAVAVGMLSFGVYYSTMYRTIAGGDSGDFVACSCNLGVAHPPGQISFTFVNVKFFW